MSVTFLHTSDWQIGATYWMLDADGQARLDQARLDAIRTMGRIARDTGCSFIIVAGDVFDSNSLKESTLQRALEEMKRLPVPVLLLPGNHDPLTADSIFTRTTGLDNVIVLDGRGPFQVPGVDDVEILAAPLTTKHVDRDVVAEMLEGVEPAPASIIRIGVGHGAAASHAGLGESNNIDIQVMEEAIDRGIIDYLALGDTHSTMQVDSAGRVYYSGAPEVTDFHDFDGYPLGAERGGNENNSGNCLVVTIDKNTTKTTVDVSEHHTGQWRFEAHTLDCNSAEDVEDFISFLDSFDDKARTVIKYALRGTIDIASKQRLEQQLSRLEPTFAALYRRERLDNLQLAPSDDDLASLGLTGYAAKALEELTAAGEDDAISLLFRLSKDTQ